MAWIVESLFWALLCTLVVGGQAGLSWAFVVVLAWCAVAGLANFVVDNLNGATQSPSQATSPVDAASRAGGPASLSQDERAAERHLERARAFDDIALRPDTLNRDYYQAQADQARLDARLVLARVERKGER